MKWKSFFLSFFLCSPLFAKGPEQNTGIYDFSKGLDTYHSSLSLPDGFVQDSQNVLFDAQAPVSKRQGYTVSFSTKAYAYQSAWTYTDATNTSWIIVRASDSLIASNLAGTVVLISTVSANDIVGEANAFGNAYFIDPTQAVYFWNGSTTTYVSGSPHGSLITQFHSRLWASGAAVPNGSQVYSSGFLAGNTWALGPNATDPVQLTAGLQDNFDNVTAMYAYLDTLYIFKHYSIYSLSGFDQTSFLVSFVSSECGCIDQNSIQTFGGALKFVSLRGVENFDGYRCTRISDPIKDKVDPAIQVGAFSQSSWVQSTQSDWQAGSSTNTSNKVSPPNLTLSGTQSTFSNPPDWTTSVGTSTFSSNSITLSTMCVANPIICLPYAESRVNYSSVTQSVNSSWYMQSTVQFSACNPSIHPTQPCIDDAAGLQYHTTTDAGYEGYSEIQFFNSTFLFGFLICKNSTPNNQQASTFCNKTLYSSSSTIAADVSPHVMGLSKIGSNITLTWDGAVVSTATDSQISSATVANLVYATDLSTSSAQVQNVSFSNFYLQSSSGTFGSQVHNAGSFNSWGNFAVSDNLNGGNIAFSICSSSNVNMIPDSCAVQTANSQITVPVNSFVNWYATFTVTAATQTPTLVSGTVQWFTGAKSIPMASTIWDNRYWLSLTTTTADSSNDAILVLANSGAWADFNIRAAGLTQYKNSLYHPDSLATGNVYLDNQGYMDNGVPINAYIKTKDYTQGDLTEDNFLEEIWPSMDDSGPYNVTVNYFPDRTSIGFPLGQVAMSEFANDASAKMMVPIDSAHQVFGKSMAYFFQASDANSPWNFYGLKEFYSTRPTQ